MMLDKGRKTEKRKGKEEKGRDTQWLHSVFWLLDIEDISNVYYLLLLISSMESSKITPRDALCVYS